MSTTSNTAAKALDFYFAQDEITPPSGQCLIIGGRPGPWSKSLTEKPTVLCYLANDADAWRNAGIEPCDSPTGHYDTIIHFGTKFADENLVQIGTWSQQLKPEGRWISVIHNRMGASRLKKDLDKLFGELTNTSKAKCRIFDTSSQPDLNLAKKWHKLAQPKAIKSTAFLTTPGIFSAEKIDTGSQLFAELLKKEGWYGSGADLGAGYGFLSHCVLNTRHKIREIVLYELDRRALDCAKLNLADFPQAEYRWTDVSQGITHQRLFDWVIMNPPFHEAQDQNFSLGKKFITEAARMLKPGGSLFLVANLHLPYEETLHTHFRSLRLLAEDKGFKCFHARK